MDEIKDSFPNLPERISGLGQLAFNLWWCWHPAARMLFKRLDRKMWKETFHNQVKLLKILPKERLEEVAGDADFLKHYDRVLAQSPGETEGEVCWFTENVREASCQPSPIFPWNTACTVRCRFMPAGWGSWRVTISKKAATWGCPW